MHPSGAFRSLHCLIYKVHASRRNICYLSTSFSVCQVLFSSFFNFFEALSFARFRRSLGILPYLSAFVKYFFQVLFDLIFSAQHSLYMISKPQRFVNPFCIALGDWLSASDSLCNIPFSSTIVNTFFKKFLREFEKLWGTFRRPHDILFFKTRFPYI